MNNELMSRYKKFFDKISGWFLFEFIYTLEELNDIHKKFNIKGNILEIGVYQGKTFIPLSFLLGEEEQIVGIDCFEDQECNSSRSGLICAKSNTVTNLQKIYFWKYADFLSKFRLIKSDSTLLKPNMYLNFITNKLSYRIICIDGGHDEKTVEIDLNNAAELICKDGFIIIDDYKNYYKEFEDSPIHGIGVTQAVDKFLLKNKNFKIYKFIHNKLIIYKEY